MTQCMIILLLTLLSPFYVNAAGQNLTQSILSPFTFFAQKESPEEAVVPEETVVADADVIDENLIEAEVTPGVFASAESTDITNDVAVSEKIQEKDDNTIELDLENADLSTLVKQMETLFQATFLSDDLLEPMPQDAKPIKGNKITFKTNRPLSKEETWNVFLTLMDMARFSVIPYNEAERIYKITSLDKAKKSALKSYIAVKSENVPENDEFIRYVYFVENANPEGLLPIIDAMRSPLSDRVFLKNHKAFMITDRAYNIKMMLKIIEDLDSDDTPESLVVIKLRFAEAKQVAELYQSLMPKEDFSRLSVRKQPTALYFPENVKIIPEPKTNAVFLVGPRSSTEKVEAFITKHIDIPAEQVYAPFFVYRLKYADAETIAEILTNMAQFGKETEVGRAGGIRGENRYFQPLIFVAEKETNSVIIKGKYEDYLLVRDIIAKLDEQQPQISVQFLIITVDVEDNKKLGAQIRSKYPGPNIFGQNVQFQTSGLYGTAGIVQNQIPASTGAQRLLGNLLELINGAVSGTTIISLGSDKFGVWGIFEMLQTLTNTEVVQNPFFIASNKTPAKISIGEERRVITSTVASGSGDIEARGADQALLEIKTTPQINSDGKIVLPLSIDINDFLNASTSANNANKTIKHFETNLVIADGEIQAIGGFIRDKVIYGQSKVPLMGDLPIVGWFFKNKSKQVIKQHLLILVTASIIDTADTTKIDLSTQKHIAHYHGILDEMKDVYAQKDPIHRMFFADRNKTDSLIDNYLFERNRASKKRQRMRDASRSKSAEAAV
jgi:general secretion pathway protein D